MRKLVLLAALAAPLALAAPAAAHNTFWSGGPYAGHDGTLTCNEARYLVAITKVHGTVTSSNCGTRVNATAVYVNARTTGGLVHCLVDQDPGVYFSITCRH